MPAIINWRIAGHPLNWVIVTVVLLFWIFFFDLVHAWINGRNPGDAAMTTNDNPTVPAFRSIFAHFTG